MFPAGVGGHLRPLGLAVGGVFVNPAVDQRIELAALRHEIVQRFAEIAELHRIAELGVEIELSRQGAGSNGVGPMVDEHVAPPLLFRVVAARALFPEERGPVNMLRSYPCAVSPCGRRRGPNAARPACGDARDYLPY